MTKHWATATPFEISSYDNPETIRFRKYATGTHLVVHGTEVEAGLTPKEEVWRKGEARLSITASLPARRCTRYRS